MARIVNDFRTFVSRGSVVDLAVGIVIGAAFTTVVKSFVDDILMPPIGMLAGGVDFADLYLNLSGGRYASLEEARAAGAATVNYGVFLNNVIAFLIVAFAVFLIVQAYNRMRADTDAGPAEPTDRECPFCRFKVPLAASRCAHCTSELAPAAAQA